MQKGVLKGKILQIIGFHLPFPFRCLQNQGDKGSECHANGLMPARGLVPARGCSPRYKSEK
jgi:hypothetical protein